MQSYKIVFTTLVTLLTTVSTVVTVGTGVVYSSPPATNPTEDSRQTQADQLFQQGIQQYRANQLKAAIQSWQQALKLYQQLQNRQREGATLGNLGAAYLALGDYRKAIEFLEPFLAIAKTTNNQLGEAQALSNLGIAYQELGNYDKAVEYYHQGLVKAQAVGDTQAEKIALKSLALVYTDQANYAKAIEYYTQSLTLARKTGDRNGEAQTLGNLGIAYKQLQDYEKAVESNQQALALMRELKDSQGEGEVLVNLGNTYEALGYYDKAIESYQQSLKITQELNDRQGEGIVLGNLGAIYANEGKYDEAIKSYQQSLAIAQVMGDKAGEANTLNNLAIAHHVQGDTNKAIEYYTQSLTLARSINNRRLEAKTLGGLGLAYEDRQDFTKAIEHQQQTLNIARAIGDRRLEGLAFNNLGHALLSAGKLPEAEKQLREAVKVFESLRPGLKDADNISIFDTQVLTYNLLQQILIAQNKSEAALEISERGRARAFVELLAQRLSPQAAENYQANAEPPTIQQIQQIAKTQNATLVEYAIVPDDEFKFQGKLRGSASEVLIWVVQPSGNVAFRRVDLKFLREAQRQTKAKVPTSLEELVRVSRNLDGIDAKRSEAARKQLYQLLIEPIAEFLPKDPKEHVIFIPQESLFLLPFPALLDASDKYLIEKHTILTAPAIQVLNLTHQQRQRLSAGNTEVIQGKDVLVVGNPTMPAELEPLPSAEQEALAIAQLLNTKAITGGQATKVSIVQQLSQARLVHLATHGLLDDVKKLGIPGAIALAPSKEDEGFLTSGEILNLRLNAELVVLSACNTGRGKITGDGVIGLSRSFITAGVPSVIVSLWSIPDAPTAVLMTDFYRNLKVNPDKAQALRQAMLTTMKQQPNPFNWAAFTLIGEAK
jgi:CHAT domain-containing protein/Flp pilus assembly protein TadD